MLRRKFLASVFGVTAVTSILGKIQCQPELKEDFTQRLDGSRVYYVDVSEITPEQADRLVAKIKEKIKKNRDGLFQAV